MHVSSHGVNRKHMSKVVLDGEDILATWKPRFRFYSFVIALIQDHITKKEYKMENKNLLVITLLCFVVISGCTSLSSKQLLNQEHTPQGLTYRLPSKQFSVKTTYEITGCNAEGTNAGLEADVSASFTESLIGAEAYTIDYKQLNTWTKITNTEFLLSEAGLLTGVNASITDQSGAIIQNSVTAAANIAKAVALPLPTLATSTFATSTKALPSVDDFKIGQPFDPSSLTDALNKNPSKFQQNALKQLTTYGKKTIDTELQKQIRQLVTEASDPCVPITKVLTAKKKAETELKEEKNNDKERSNQEVKINQADLQIKTLKDMVETYLKLGDDSERGKLLKRVQLQENIKAEAETALKILGESKTDKIAKELAEAKGKLTVVGSLDFVPSITKKSKLVPVINNELSKLVDGRLETSEIILPEVTITVEALSSISGEESKVPVAEEIGIAYRIPVTAIAKVQCQDKYSIASSPIVLVEKTTQVPQYGPIGSINLNNIMFDDNLIELAFNGSTGAPSKLTFRAKSKGEAATATLSEASGTYMQLQKDKRDNLISANKTMTDQALAQVALEKAISDLNLSKVKADSAVTTTQAELQQSLVTSQLQLLRDQQRLDAVRSGTATTAEVELQALNTQEQLLAQRLKILKLEQEIADQTTKASAK